MQRAKNRLLQAARKRKLGPRLLSGFLLVALLPSVVLCGIAYIGAREQILQGEERSSLRMAQYLQSELSALLQSNLAKLNTVASDMAVIRLIRHFRKADPVEAATLQYELMGRLISEAAGQQGFMSMEIVTDEGVPISELPFSIMNDELFERIKAKDEKFAFWVGQYRWGDLYPDASPSKRDKTVAVAARRIVDYANVKRMGYIIIAFDCGELERLLPDDTGANFIISDSEGTVMASVGEDRAASVSLARQLSASSPPQALESSTLKHLGGSYLLITGNLSDSPYRLTMAISYSHIFAGLTRIFKAVVSTAVCVALLMLAIAWWLTGSVTVPVARLSQTMRRFGTGDFEARVRDAAFDEVGMLCLEFDEMADHVRALTAQLCEAQRKEQDAVYAALQAQINPHFLYNTLDMLSWMGYEASNPDICKIVASLSDFFRLGLNKGEEHFVLRDEISHVKSYINIQQYRMRNIHFEVDAPGELLSVRVPKLMVQPLVENAIQHGLKPRNYRGSIWVRAEEAHGVLLIRVSDDGAGFEEALLRENAEKSSGYGIRNIRQRLSLLYGGQGGLEILTRPAGGTTAVLRIPIEGWEEAVNEDSHRR